MATRIFNTCPACGSADIAAGELTCKCNKCGHVGETRIFRKQHASRNVGIRPDSSSVPRVNRKRQKGQRRIWKPGREE